MKCSVVSFITKSSSKKSKTNFISKNNTRLMTEILNNVFDVDLILFSGWTLSNRKELDSVLTNNKNKHTTYIFEVGDGHRNKDNPKSDVGFYVAKGKKLIKKKIKQVFTSSKDIHSLKTTIPEYLDKLESERFFKVNNKKVRLIICGENNILKNKQKQGNRVSLRSSETELNKKFDSILKNTNIFLNPAHTPMGNLGKMKKRWEYLSKNQRALLFVTNESTKQGIHKPNFHKLSLQYLFVNGKETKSAEEIKERYKISTINI